MLTHALLAFLFQKLPQNDTIPRGVGCHTALKCRVLCNLSFYWAHSGFHNDNKDRLQSEIIITTGLRNDNYIKKGGEVILVWDIFRP